MSESKCGAGRGSDTTGAATRNSRPTLRRYCYRECRDPFFNECADCWRSGGNPALVVRETQPSPAKEVA